MSALSTSRAEAWRLRAGGLVYLAVIAALVALSVATYQKVFGDHVTVVVEAERAGSQLNVGGDVRMNGAIVGRVSGVELGEDGARIELQVDRADARRIPASALARIVPTTLFGQKYVELRSGEDASLDPLREGSVLAEDRSREAVELTGVVDRLEPVLTAVQPQQLSATLGALAQGLGGRGERLGRTMDRAGAYLGELNALAPTFEEDLRLLREVSGQYADVAPEALSLLDSFSTTAATLDARQGDLAALLTGTSAAARSGERLLRSTRRDLVAALGTSRPTLDLLATYSPQLVCSLQGFEAARDDAAAQIRGGSVHGEFSVTQPVSGYSAEDGLKLGDVGAGPACRGLPDPVVPYPAIVLDDGVERDPVLAMLTAGLEGQP